MGRIGIRADIAVGRAMRGMAGRIAAVAVGAARPARTAAMRGLIGAGATVIVGERPAAMVGAVSRIPVGNLGLGRAAGAEDGQCSAPHNGPTGNTAKK
jgi:hypothetical protein